MTHGTNSKRRNIPTFELQKDVFKFIQQTRELALKVNNKDLLDHIDSSFDMDNQCLKRKVEKQEDAVEA